VEARERLVYLTTVVGTIQGHLVVGRLETEGVRAVMRGTGDGPYPFPSEVDVLVPESQLQTAQEILLADAVETVFDELGRPPGRRTSLSRRFHLRRKAGS
jgi:hypothetical protein